MNQYLPGLFIAAVVCGCNSARQSLDLTVGGNGVSFGNSARINGLRFNYRDTDVDTVNGVNVTLWKPRSNPDFVMRGVALGLARTDAEFMTGLSLGSVVGANNADGVNLGLLAIWSEGAVRGLNIGSFMTWAGQQLVGINVGLMVSGGRDIWGLTLAGLAISPKPVTDILDPHQGTLGGINACGLIIDYPHLKGVTLGGLVHARHTTGLTGAWFLSDIRKSTTGLSIAPVNFTGSLRGVQIGLLNYVASHPHPFKWLPLINVGWDESPGAPGKEQTGD